MLTTVMDARRSVRDAERHDDDTSTTDRPALDEFGLLRYRGEWVALSSSEERMLRPLLAGWGRVVHTRDLAESVWPGRTTRSTSLHTLVHRLRRRLRPLGLTVETIRARGFLMEPVRRAAATRGTDTIDLTSLTAELAGDLHEGPT